MPMGRNRRGGRPHRGRCQPGADPGCRQPRGYRRSRRRCPQRARQIVAVISDCPPGAPAGTRRRPRLTRSARDEPLWGSPRWCRAFLVIWIGGRVWWPSCYSTFEPGSVWPSRAIARTTKMSCCVVPLILRSSCPKLDAVSREELRATRRRDLLSRGRVGVRFAPRRSLPARARVHPRRRGGGVRQRGRHGHLRGRP
jgi:hypothetical protein